MYEQPLIGERLVNVVYKPHLVLTKEDGAVTSYSELLGLAFYWREERGFDILDTEKNITIDKVEIDRTARMAAEARIARAEARLAKQARADASEARVRMLQDTLERLRRQQSGQ